MRKPTFCIMRNQRCCNRKTDQCLCFRCRDSTILLFSKTLKFPASCCLKSVLVQIGLCWTSSETILLVFLCRDSNLSGVIVKPEFISNLFEIPTGRFSEDITDGAISQHGIQSRHE